MLMKRREGLTLITSTGIMELNFMKRGCLRLRKRNTHIYNSRRTVQQRTVEGTSRRHNGFVKDRNTPIKADFRDTNGAA